MKKPWNILLGAVLLAGLALLAAVLHHYQLKAAEEHYRTELKAKGEPMDLAQALPPSVPPEQNSAESFLKACALMEKNETLLSTNPVVGKMMVAPGKAMIGAMQPDIREPGKFGFTNSWTEAETAIGQNKECLELLRGIIAKPKIDFHIPYANGFVGATVYTNLYLIELKRSASLLASAAIVDLHRDNPGAAVTNTLATLEIVQAMEDQRVAISELVRIAIANIAQNPTWEILQSPSVTDGELATLQSGWDSLNFTQSYANALTMERIVDDNTLAQWRESNTELEKYLGLFRKARQNLLKENEEDEEKLGFFQQAKLSVEIFMWRYWWSYADELRNLRGREVLMETARGAKTNAALGDLLRQQQAGLGVLKLDSNFDPFAALFGEPDLHSMLSDSIVSLGACFRKVISVEAMKHMTVTAIALKRFQLRHGNYPQKLSELASEFLPAVPLDPEDGQPLRYRRNGDGTFILYSIGPNGKDDGGDPSLEKGTESSSSYWLGPHALDWVWPQPATEAEIQKYFADQTKKSD